MAAFTLFPKLPQELQDSIWELAIPIGSRRAYHIRLVYQTRWKTVEGLPISTTKYRFHLFNISSSMDYDEAVSTMANLLITCRRASCIAIRTYSARQPAAPFSLHGLNYPINSASDLVVIQNGWQRSAREYSSQVRVPFEDQPKPLRYVAVEWPGPGHDDGYFSHFNSLMGFLSLWDQLKAFYVVVQPDHLLASERPWAPSNEIDWGIAMGPDPTWESFIADCSKDSEDQDLVFYCHGREYYEVPTEQLCQYGGLEEVVGMLERARWWCDGDVEDSERESNDHPIRFRILTWRMPDEGS